MGDSAGDEDRPMTKTIKYYGGMYYNPRDPKRDRMTVVFRWVRGDGPLRTERWDGEKWVHCQEAARIMGTGGVSGTERITKEQADEFINKGKKGGEGSGHHDHGGLPGVWGGSTPSGRAPAKKPPAKKPTAKKPPVKKPKAPEKEPVAKKPPEKEPQDFVSREDWYEAWDNTAVNELSEGALEEVGLERDDLVEMFSLPGADTEIGVWGDGKIVITWRDYDGDLVGTALRELHFENGICRNEELYLEDKFQDMGIASSLYSRQKAVLKERGYEKIVLLANVSIGRYAWAKKGFNYRYAKDGIDNRDEIQAWMTNLGLVREAQEHGKLFDTFTKPSDYANFNIPGAMITGRQINNYDVAGDYSMPIGKAFMLDWDGHGSWWGEYDL